jgi:hypothetical protein
MVAGVRCCFFSNICLCLKTSHSFPSPLPQAYLSHKGIGAPLPSLSAIVELRAECLLPLLEEVELELFMIQFGLRRARPLALPAPEKLRPPPAAPPALVATDTALRTLFVLALLVVVLVYMTHMLGRSPCPLPLACEPLTPLDTLPPACPLDLGVCLVCVAHFLLVPLPPCLCLCRCPFLCRYCGSTPPRPFSRRANPGEAWLFQKGSGIIGLYYSSSCMLQ